MKKCILCTSELDDAAKKCAKCGSFQTIFEKHRTLFLSFMLALFLLVIFKPYIEKEFFTVDFSKYRNDISISDTSVRFRTDQYGTMATVLGNLNNKTSYTWTRMKFEISFYDKDGSLLYSDQQTSFETFPADNTFKYKIEVPVYFKETEFSKVDVKIVTAKNPLYWDY